VNDGGSTGSGPTRRSPLEATPGAGHAGLSDERARMRAPSPAPLCTSRSCCPFTCPPSLSKAGLPASMWCRPSHS